MSEPVTWTAVAMAAIANVGTWIVLYRGRKNGAGPSSKRLGEIKEEMEKTNGKLDTVSGQVNAVGTAVAEVKGKVDGQLSVCADTRKVFREAIKDNADRMFEHIAIDHKGKP